MQEEAASKGGGRLLLDHLVQHRPLSSLLFHLLLSARTS
jgi:hypothetical protein